VALQGVESALHRALILAETERLDRTQPHPAVGAAATAATAATTATTAVVATGDLEPEILAQSTSAQVSLLCKLSISSAAVVECSGSTAGGSYRVSADSHGADSSVAQLHPTGGAR
jgi:hypothetical protein